MRSARVVWMILALTTGSCTSGGGATAPAKAPMPQPPPPAPAAPAPEAAAVDLSALKALDLSGLGAADQAALAQVLQEEICPCGCPQSFAACIQKPGACVPGEKLANFVIDQMKQGLPADVVGELLAGEVSGFSGQPKQPNPAGFAAKGAHKPQFEIIEFADFECGHCKAAADVLDRLVKKYPDRVRVVFKHFPLSFHSLAKRAAAAAEAAGQQGRFWEMHDAIFATQTMLDDDLIRGHAKALGLDFDRFEKDWNDPATLAKVDASRAEGETLGIEATPTLYVNGRPFQLMRTLQALELRLAMESARDAMTCQ